MHKSVLLIAQNLSSLRFTYIPDFRNLIIFIELHFCSSFCEPLSQFTDCGLETSTPHVKIDANTKVCDSHKQN